MDKDKNKIDVLLKEYEILRGENHNSINNRNKIISFGLATIGIIYAAMFSADPGTRMPILVLPVFSLGIPAISILVLYLWLGEVERLVRAGEYLRKLEDRINNIVDKEEATLCWEKWILSEKRQIKYPYISAILLFLFLASAAPLIGIILDKRTFIEIGWAAIIPWIIEILILCDIWGRTKTFK